MTLMGIVQNHQGLYACRFFLGITEVGPEHLCVTHIKDLHPSLGRILSWFNLSFDDLV